MTSDLKQFRNVTPHLELLATVPLEGSGQFVLHKDHVFMSARYGSAHTLNVVDVSKPAEPRLVEAMKFKRAISSVDVRDDLIYAAENGRAVNFINVENPGRPDYFECGVALGKDMYDLKLLGKYAVFGMNWQGIGIMDISDLPSARFLHSVKLDDGFIERIAIAGDRIFAAGAAGGLRVFEIHNDQLVEVASYREDAFNASRVFNVSGRMWVVGQGEEDKDDRVLVIDPEAPGVVESSFVPEKRCPDKALLPLKDGGAVGFYNHYTCLAYSAEAGWGGEIFKQFTKDEDDSYLERPIKEEYTDEEREKYDVSSTCMDGIDWAVRKGNHLIAAQGSAVVVYRIPKGSIFEGVVEDA